MAVIHINFEIEGEDLVPGDPGNDTQEIIYAPTSYTNVEVSFHRLNPKIFASGDVVADWNASIDFLLEEPGENTLLCSSSVHDFMVRVNEQYELYTARSRVGHPFSYASYMRRVEKKAGAA